MLESSFTEKEEEKVKDGHSEMNDQYLDVLRLNYFEKSLDFFRMM